MRTKSPNQRRMTLINAEQERRERDERARSHVESTVMTYGPKGLWLKCTEHPNRQAIAIVGDRDATGTGLRAMCGLCFLWYAEVFKRSHDAEGNPRI
jgi:hypothetical protein